MNDSSRLGEQFRRLIAQLGTQRARVADAVQRRTDRQFADVQWLGNSVEAHVRQVDALKTELRRLRAAHRNNLAYTEKLEARLPRHVVERVRLNDRLERIAASQRPIVVGPWTGEVGYEVLYWAPFVRWFAQEYDVDPGRFHVISRGGPVSWYGEAAAHYTDVLSFFTPDEFREQARARGWLKQDRVTSLDREILRRARRALGVGPVTLLHPSLMFRLFKGFWGTRLGLNEVLTHTSYTRLIPPSPVVGLPSRYTAVRFYFRSSFPDTAANRALVIRVLSALTTHTDVVVLNPGFRLDDHHDYDPERSGRIRTIDHLLVPDRNLEVQTAVIARADAFVGSYGGFSYLAPLLGVRSIAFYSELTFKTAHLELAEHVFNHVSGGSLTVLNAADVDVIAGALAGLAGCDA